MNPSDQTTQEIDETTGAVYGYRSYVSTLYREDLKTGAIDVLELPVEGYGQPQVNALAKGGQTALSGQSVRRLSRNRRTAITSGRSSTSPQTARCSEPSAPISQTAP